MKRREHLWRLGGRSYHSHRRWEEAHAKKDWTKAERNTSKFNAKVLSTIFGGVEIKQFQLIHGITSVEEA